jgi:putative transposase
MGQSLVRNYIHIVFSTKHRAAFIDDHVEQALHKYLGGICTKLGCLPLKIGGYTDHVHILCSLPSTISLMKLVEEVKRGSSKWMKTQGKKYDYFYWQDGYGAFSVAHSQLDSIIAYISRQHIHHSQFDFKEEYRGVLLKYGVEYDERYVWD